MLRYAFDWKDGWRSRNSLMEAFGWEDDAWPRVISLVGAGGKTTTMYRLAEEFGRRGARVLVTTTTHILYPGEEHAVLVRHVSDIRPEMWKGSVLTAGCAAPEVADGMKKLRMPEGMDMEREFARLTGFCDVILIEADGSARHPLKVCREGEPVILPWTQALIACAGLSAVGEPFGESCFRFASCGGWMKRLPQAQIGPRDVAAILSDKRGLGVSWEAFDAFYIVLNQGDSPRRREQAAAIVAALPDGCRERCVLTAYKKEERI